METTCNRGYLLFCWLLVLSSITKQSLAFLQSPSRPVRPQLQTGIPTYNTLLLPTFLKMTGNPANDNGAADEAFSISIWLIPSPEYRENVAKAIDAFSEHPAASATFEPHVTVVGSVTCPSNEYLQTTLVPKLKQAIQESSSCMDCRFLDGLLQFWHQG